uniref:PKD_channel domain-containing protein n=1 Tax=Brugia timori TaxID=42155 RepID=A0A0R3QMT0_9BILA
LIEQFVVSQKKFTAKFNFLWNFDDNVVVISIQLLIDRFLLAY